MLNSTHQTHERERRQANTEEKNCKKRTPTSPLGTCIHTFLHSKHCRKTQLLLLFLAALINPTHHRILQRGKLSRHGLCLLVSLPGARASLTAGPAGGRRLPLPPASRSVPAQEDLRKKRCSLFRHPLLQPLAFFRLQTHIKYS
jgi:hypothetical protein